MAISIEIPRRCVDDVCTRNHLVDCLLSTLRNYSTLLDADTDRQYNVPHPLISSPAFMPLCVRPWTH